MKPPHEIPHDLQGHFTLGGQIGVDTWYLDDTQEPSISKVYRLQEVTALVTQARQKGANYYGSTDSFLFEALEHHPIVGKEIGIIGSQVPWYEAVAIASGAASVTTIEYQTIVSEDPRIQTLTPEQYRRAPRYFDAIFSISSIEHDGLGRYGDPINPDGDRQAMSQSRAMLRPGGILFLAVPVGKDKLVWNAHRVYGRLRLPLILDGWRVLGSVGMIEELLDTDFGKEGPVQPVFILQKP